MSQDKFTPGPWNLTPPIAGLEEAQNWYLSGPEREPIGEIGHPDSLSSKIAANAQLIASAPELLAALEAALRLDYFNEHNQLADMARKAVAKAKGTK